MTDETKKQILERFTTEFEGELEYRLYNELLEFIYEEVDKAETRGEERIKQ